MNAAVANLGQQLDDKAASLPTQVLQISGLVADVSGDTLIVNVGSKAGVKVGDVLGVFRQGRQNQRPGHREGAEDRRDQTRRRDHHRSGRYFFNGTYTGQAPKVGDAVRNSQ